jgi:hypothetical protein
MKPFIKAATAFLFILSLLCADQAFAQTNSTAGNSQIEIAYIEPSSHNYRPLYDRLRKRQVLEELQQLLSPLRLPRKLKVQVEQCGAPTRSYKPEQPVTVCYEQASWRCRK